MHRTAFRASRALLAFIAAAMPAACSTPPSQTGVRIGDETLKQFKAGTTTESWLLAVLGPPTNSSAVQNIPNTAVYRYSLSQASSGLGALFSGEASKNTSVVYFIITDGIVTRFWADRALEHTVMGNPVEQTGEKQAQ